MSHQPRESIWSLDIPRLTGCVLEDRGLCYVHELLPYTEDELRAIPRIGKKGIAAIKKGLALRQLSLRSG